MRRVSCAVAIGCLFFLAASLTAEAVSAQPHLTLGVNRTTLSAQTPAVQEKTLNDIQALGAQWFRDGPTSGSPRGVANFVEELARARQHKLKVQVNRSKVEVHQTTSWPRSAKSRAKSPVRCGRSFAPSCTGKGSPIVTSQTNMLVLFVLQFLKPALRGIGHYNVPSLLSSSHQFSFFGE